MLRLQLCVIAVLMLYSCRHVSGQEAVRLGQATDALPVPVLLQQAKLLRPQAPDSAIILYKRALAVAKQAKDNTNIANALFGIGSCLYDKRLYDKAKHYFTEATPYCAQAPLKDRSKLQARLYGNMANVYIVQGDIDTAVKLHFRALATIEKDADIDTAMLIMAYGNLGATLGEAKHDRQSLYYYQKAAALALQQKDMAMLANIYSNAGTAYEHLGQRDSAMQRWMEALRLYREQKRTANMQTLYYAIGTGWILRNNVQKAKSYLDSAVWIDPQMALENAGLQKKLGDITYLTTGSDRAAIPYFKKALEIAARKGITHTHLTTQYTLGEAYHHLSENATAYLYMKAYADLKDSLMNMEMIRTLNQQEVRYRTKEKEQEILAKQLLIARQEKSLLQKNLWIMAASGSLLLLVLLLIAQYRNSLHKQKLQMAAIDNLKLQRKADQLAALMQGEENERLRLARELHDGVGSILAAARMHLDVLKEKNLQEDASGYHNGMNLLDEAYQGLRDTAHNLLPPEQLMEEGLLAATAMYCNKISKPGSFNIHFQHYGALPDLQPETALSFYRIIQELIHNAAKHADAGEVIVEIGVDGDQLSINVEDNGKGWKIAEDIKKGVGIRNLKHRVEILGGFMEIDSRSGIGTTVYLTFDLNRIVRNEAS